MYCPDSKVTLDVNASMFVSDMGVLLLLCSCHMYPHNGTKSPRDKIPNLASIGTVDPERSF